MDGRFKSVEFSIYHCQIERFLTAIEAMYERCSCLESVHRKSSRVAKRIEHLFAVGKLTEQFSVLALVDKEARFLSAFPIHIKRTSMLFA